MIIGSYDYSFQLYNSLNLQNFFYSLEITESCDLNFTLEFYLSPDLEERD